MKVDRGVMHDGMNNNYTFNIKEKHILSAPMKKEVVKKTKKKKDGKSLLSLSQLMNEIKVAQKMYDLMPINNVI